MTTLLEVLQKGTHYLQSKGVESPRLDMELLVAHLLKVPRMQLYLDFDKPMPEEALAEMRSLLKRRSEREPLQHLIGEVEFFGRSFKTDARALIPRPETEELVEIVVKKLQELTQVTTPLRILDLCCGSGVIGLSLKAHFGERVQVTLADLSAEALSLATENAEKLEVEAEFVESDLFTKLSGTFDLIVCNPPYVSTQAELSPEVQKDPAMALFSGVEGMDHLTQIIPVSRSFLAPAGLLYFEIGYDQADRVEKLLKQADFHDVEILADLDKIRRFPVARI